MLKMENNTIEAIAAIGVIVQIILIGFNAFMMLNIKPQISHLQLKIEQYRRADMHEMRDWVELKLKEYLVLLKGGK